LKHAVAVEVPHPAESSENFQSPKLSSATKTRSATAVPKTIILPPRATQEQVAEAYGISIQAFYAAQKREKTKTANLGHME